MHREGLRKGLIDGNCNVLETFDSHSIWLVYDVVVFDMRRTLIYYYHNKVTKHCSMKGLMCLEFYYID